MQINPTISTDRIYHFQISPLVMFCIPPSRPGACTVSPHAEVPTELVVDDLDAFHIPEIDLPRIAETAQAALNPG